MCTTGRKCFFLQRRISTYLKRQKILALADTFDTFVAQVFRSVDQCVRIFFNKEAKTPTRGGFYKKTTFYGIALNRGPKLLSKNR
jgi:hypothetical protein